MNADWFAVEEVAPGVFAIGEPGYHQANWSYLIDGADWALMFDTGPGLRDIRKAAERLTAKPLIALASHLHYDHTGNLGLFDAIACADLPLLRGFARGGLLHAPADLYLGHYEDMVWRPVAVNHWWPIGGSIDPGGRPLELLHLPGHSPDSVALFDRAADLLFAADFVYPGPLYAQVPHASLPDYLASAEALSPRLTATTRLCCGHGGFGKRETPVLGAPAIEDLAQTLRRIRDGRQKPSAIDPLTYAINADMTLLASKASLGPWQEALRHI